MFQLYPLICLPLFLLLVGSGTECVPTCHDTVNDIFVDDVVLVRLQHSPTRLNEASRFSIVLGFLRGVAAHFLGKRLLLLLQYMVFPVSFSRFERCLLDLRLLGESRRYLLWACSIPFRVFSSSHLCLDAFFAFLSNCGPRFWPCSVWPLFMVGFGLI